MSFHKFFEALVLSLLIIGPGTNLSDQNQYPVKSFTNCDVPPAIVEKIRLGINFALRNNAAFVLDDADLFHVHLLITKDHDKLISDKGSITATELMESTDALLFHSQEEDFFRDSFPVEVRKRRNILYDLRSGELKILDVANYPVDVRYFTVWPDKDLGLVETFNVSFYKIPSFDDQGCKLSPFNVIYNGPVVITEIWSVRTTFAANSCTCSGKVYSW